MREQARKRSSHIDLNTIEESTYCLKRARADKPNEGLNAPIVRRLKRPLLSCSP
jgi:hypothetical protein